MNRLILTGLLLVVVSLVAWPARAQEDHRAALAEADLALLSGDVPAACAAWTSLLTTADPLRDVAAFHLAQWGDHCAIPTNLEALAGGARTVRTPAEQTFRTAGFVQQMAERAGMAELAESLQPRRLDSHSSGYLPVQAPTTWTFATTTWPDGDVGGEGLGTGGVAWQRYCFDNRAEVDLAVELVFPNPGRARLDGQELLLVGPDAGGRFPVTRSLAVKLSPGTHELRTLQGISAAQAPVQVALFPADAVAPVPCGEDAGAGWRALPASPRPKDDFARLRVALAHGELSEADLQELAGQALESPENYLLYRSALREGNLTLTRQDELERELAASFLGIFDACLPRLDLADAALDAGERDAARKLLDEADEACLDSAQGLLLQAEVARWMQWSALQDRYLQEAAARYPDNCEVQTRTLERNRERGLVLRPPTHPCPQVRALLEIAELRREGKVDMPAAEAFDEAFFEAPNPVKERLLPRLAARLDEPAWRKVADGLSRRDPQFAWAIADALLAVRRTDLAADFARRAAGHRNTWESLRSQAGRILFWDDLVAQQAPVDTVIDRYIEDGFAAGSPQVVVLDEAVARPGGSGWVTLAETTVLHVASPDAAEAIGEVSVGPDEELLELAVRKADGRWFGPVHPGSVDFKETLSLAGLAPGDFIVRRSIKEVALQDGPLGCAPLPTFYFTPREAPVYLSRYILLDPDRQYRLISQGELEFNRTDQGIMAELTRLAPVPAEPRCPEHEAGIAWLQPVPECASWDRLRDRVGDVLLGYCNTTPDLAGARSPDAIYKWVVKQVEEDGSSLFDASLREILGDGSGNRALTLYCALVQAGYDAHIVATHSAAAPAINLRRPSLLPFDGMLVYVSGRDGGWYDPYDRLVPPGYLRPALRNRPGIMLSARYPRLFIKTPNDPVTEGWDLTLTVDLDAQGQLLGRLVLEAAGDAAITLDRQIRTGGDETRQRLAESVLHMMMPGMTIHRQQVQTVDRKVLVRIEFSGAVDVHDVGRFVLRMPPLMPPDLVQLARRSSPLYYGGILPLRLSATFSFADELVWKAPEGVEEMVDDVIDLHLEVEQQRNRLKVTKSAYAPPRRIEPEDYDGFVRAVIRTQRLQLLPIEVRHEDAR